MQEEDKQTKSEAAKREEKVLEFWKANKVFEQSLKKKSPKGHYVFYDGPPFATGQIHYGHILGSTAKDVIGRYKTMEGYYVPRKWGWDCHGLPIENIVEKELGIAGHKEIENLGIDKFVEHARSKVLEYDKDWEKGIERIGRWVDFKGSYKTMDNTFIESVWWALNELNKKDLIYEGVRVLAYCARCETPIANSEIAMDNSYKDIADISIYVKFELEDEPGTYLVAWTTTPWTLPGNTAIAINKDVEYSLFEISTFSRKNYVNELVKKEKVIIATDNALKLFNLTDLKPVLKGGAGPDDQQKEYKILDRFTGDKLIGKKYKPVFPYYQNVEMPNKENIWKVWHADFVTTEKGTGIAHEAPAFGEEDSVLAKANNIPMIVHVDTQGRFVDAVTDFKGLKVKPKDTPEDKDAHLRTDIEIIRYLQSSGAYFDKEKIIHSYPHCMRCDTPIIYYALPSYFINIQKSKAGIMSQAEGVNWIPAHLKEGRFKNIVENAPDWNISRNRYWASPLPIWKCESCKEKSFVGSIDDLKNKGVKSGNQYFVMRHGGTEGNKKEIISYKNESSDQLTKEGVDGVVVSAGNLKNKKIDFIISSPFTRTKQTAEIVRKELDLSNDAVIFDDRLIEINPGIFDGKDWNEYHLEVSKTKDDWFNRKVEGGESFLDVAKRVGECLYEVEEKYKNKNILFVTHGGPAWLFFVTSALHLPDKKEYKIPNTTAFVEDFKRFDNAEVRELPFVPLPHNHNFQLDLHRPYIDGIKINCLCGGVMHRVPEVLDCWFESGSMPFAQDHYPFENKNWKTNNFPAGFIAEYIAQTRTWFYYTHAVSTMLFGKAAFKNVVTTGTLRAEDGEKMSKSKNNYPNPWVFIDKYGVDALRMYLMSSPLMKGEDANFSEKAVQDIASKVIGRLFNVVAFYELYRNKELESFQQPKPKDILDQWIFERLDQLIEGVTHGMNSYDMTEAIRFIDPFVDDLSTWYLRRSRERIKDGDTEAKKTLYFVLKTLSKIIAPFAPFSAEDIWVRLRCESESQSVHLEEWPKVHKSLFSFGKSNVLKEMSEVRKVVSLGLEARQKEGIKVRQPLNKIILHKYDFMTSSNKMDYSSLLQEELNIKNIEFYNNSDTQQAVLLDSVITPELKAEGDYRELVRALQDLRKTMGKKPSDPVELFIETDAEGRKLVTEFESDLKKTVLISTIEFKSVEAEEMKVGELRFRVAIK